MFFCFYMDIIYIYCRMPKKTYIPHVLSSNFNEMENYIIKNKTAMMEQVLDGVSHAISKKLKVVEIFKFTNSDFVITLSSDKFKENVDNILDYYLENEKYELCNRIKTIEKKLTNQNEKQKQKKEPI